MAVATQLARGGERSPVKLEMVKPIKQFGVDDVLLILPKSGAFERANPEILEGINWPVTGMVFTCFDMCVATFLQVFSVKWLERWLEDADVLILHTYD